MSVANLNAFALISIHAPRTGSDEYRQALSQTQHNFNPRSPHGERRATQIVIANSREISIHAPRTGSDESAQAQLNPEPEISIHAPRTGSDAISNLKSWYRTYFNPRSPHGERRNSRRVGFLCVDFNPRSPHGERPTR